MNIEALIADAVEAGVAPGMVAVAVDGGGIIAETAAGVTQAGGSTPVSADSVMWVASLTKAVTATVVMQLVEAGALALDGPARDICPDIGKLQVLLGFDAKDQPILRAPKGEITLRHLLTHTSGLAYDMWEAEIGRYQDATGAPAIGSGLKSALQSPLLFDPGTDWRYGISLDWAGQMVEAVTGTTLEQVMQDRIFGPLGMVSTGFRISPAMEQNLACMHAKNSRGVTPVPEMRIGQTAEFQGGGGGLYATARDYAAFMRLFLNDGVSDSGERLLKSETLSLMGADQLTGQRVHPLIAAIPERSLDLHLPADSDWGWGLSFLINRDDMPGRRRAGSLAWAGLSNCYYWIDRTSGLGGLVMCQTLPFADPEVLDVFDRLERAIYASRKDVAV